MFTEPFLISPLSAVPDTVTLNARKMLRAESADLSELEFVQWTQITERTVSMYADLIYSPRGKYNSPVPGFCQLN